MSAERPKVLVNHPETPQVAIDLLRESCDVTICEGLPQPTREEILTKSRGMHGILWSTHTRLDAEALDAAGPQLRALSTVSAGYDYVDVEELKRRNIPIGTTPKVLNDAVADIAVGLMIAAGRRFREGRHSIQRDQWNRWSKEWMLGQDITGSTVGIVGLGGIGQTIVRRLKGFDVARFIYTGHSPKKEAVELGATFVSLDELLRTSDFVICACPLTNETKNMFNESMFKKMKPTGVFVNIGRGACVDQDALVEALRNRTIFSAGLDVVTPEPLPVDHPLLTLDNVIVLPHLGTATRHTRDNMALHAVRNILLGLEGKPMLSPVF